MSQMIDLTNISLIDDSMKQSDSSVTDDSVKHTQDKDPFEAVSLTENEKLIREMFPGKILFSIQESANILNTSYEFIRKKVADNKIPSINCGDRRMINITTISTLITYGV